MEHLDPPEPRASWDEYSRARLQRGFSHLLGRSIVEEALTTAGARLRCLSFGPHEKGPGATSEVIYNVYWSGDGGARYFNSGPPRASHEYLSMYWHPVPAASRAPLAEDIAAVWLPRACAWAAAATTRGNVWRATEHRWMLKNEEGELTVVES